MQLVTMMWECDVTVLRLHASSLPDLNVNSARRTTCQDRDDANLLLHSTCLNPPSKYVFFHTAIQFWLASKLRKLNLMLHSSPRWLTRHAMFSLPFDFWSLSLQHESNILIKCEVSVHGCLLAILSHCQKYDWLTSSPLTFWPQDDIASYTCCARAVALNPHLTLAERSITTLQQICEGHAAII